MKPDRMRKTKTPGGKTASAEGLKKPKMKIFPDEWIEGVSQTSGVFLYVDSFSRGEADQLLGRDGKEIVVCAGGCP